RFMLVYVFFLALAPALQTGAHVSTDMVTSKLSAVWQRYARVFVYLLSSVYGVVLFWYTLLPTIEVFKNGRLFPVAIDLPMKYVYIIAPIGVAQFVFTSLVCLLLAFFSER